MKDKLIKRLEKYVKINTRSDGYSETVPSTKIQFDLANVLYEECQDLGLSGVKMDEYGIVTATLASNIDYDVPTIGFIAHMDTADFESENVKPIIIENYDGSDIILNEELNIVTDVKTFPNLLEYVGETIMHTDGTTLLGADNKAGIANILTAVEYMIENKTPHGDIRLAFTIDEEIGTGADYFDVEGFGADFAYTVDGAGKGQMEYETFNAASAKVYIKGISVHPGDAKDKMVNANLIASDFIAALPLDARPETTEDYEGFIMVTDTSANVEKGYVELIIRDHDKEKFQNFKDLLINITETLNNKYNEDTVKLDIQDSYYNMKEILDQHPEVVDLAKKSIKSIGLEPIINPVRGGTDGSKLSFRNLPTPNIFTGGENFHGKHEFVGIDSMELSAKTIIAISELNTKLGE